MRPLSPDCEVQTGEGCAGYLCGVCQDSVIALRAEVERLTLCLNDQLGWVEMLIGWGRDPDRDALAEALSQMRRKLEEVRYG